MKKLLLVIFMSLCLMVGGVIAGAGPSPYSQPPAMPESEISPELEAEFDIVVLMVKDIAEYVRGLVLVPVPEDDLSYQKHTDHIVNEILIKKHGRTLKNVGCTMLGRKNPENGLIYPTSFGVQIKGFADIEKLPIYIFKFPIKVKEVDKESN